MIEGERNKEIKRVRKRQSHGEGEREIGCREVEREIEREREIARWREREIER